MTADNNPTTTPETRPEQARHSHRAIPTNTPPPQRTPTRLHAADPRTYPASVGVGWLYGGDDAEVKREALRVFEAGVDADGVVVKWSFLANCRVLGEGVDLQSDTAVLADPRNAVVDICQILGRTVRPSPEGDKIASLVLPIFLREGETPDDMLVSPTWAPLARVLFALRSHGIDVVDVLAVPQVNGAPQETARPLVEDVDGGSEERRSLVWFSSRRDPVQLARFVRTRVLDPQRRNWLRGYAAAERYRERFGNLEIPLHTVDIDAHGVTFPVGGWVSEMRRAYANGGLDRTQIAELDALGMVWDAYDQGWRNALAHAREYARLNLGLAAPVDAIIDGFPIGRQLQKWRQGNGMKRYPKRAEQLAAIDPEWNPRHWSIDWQRHFNHLRHWQRTHNPVEPPEIAHDHDGAAVDGAEPVGTPAGARGEGVGGVSGSAAVKAGDVVVGSGGVLVVPGLATVHRGVAIGRWVERQVAGWARLNAAQREALRAVGVAAPAVGVVAGRGGVSGGPRAGRSRDEAFAVGLAAAGVFFAREGHLEVPRGHVEVVEVPAGGGLEDVRLGVWVTNTRARRGRLSSVRVAALDAVGMRW